MTSDPIGLGGGVNTYGYVGGNPVRYFDKDGLIASDINIAMSLIKPKARKKLTKEQCQMDCDTLNRTLLKTCTATGFLFMACKIEIDKIVTECLKGSMEGCDDEEKLACK